MSEFIILHFRNILIIGVIVVIVAGRFHRMLGAAIGVFFWISTAIMASVIYSADGGISLIDQILEPWMFYVICIVMALFNFAMLWVSIQNNNRRCPTNSNLSE